MLFVAVTLVSVCLHVDVFKLMLSALILSSLILPVSISITISFAEAYSSVLPVLLVTCKLVKVNSFGIST